MCRETIVDLYERHATEFANGFSVLSYLADDPACGGHTVWLTRRDLTAQDAA
jgi:hypothetical protein